MMKKIPCVAVLVALTMFAQTAKYVYVAEGCQYLSKRLPDGTLDDKSFEPPQLTMGDRLEVVSETKTHYIVRSYEGRVGSIAREKVQARDPKTYFAGIVDGRKVVGFLRGPNHCSFIDQIQMTVDGAGQAAIPIPRISRLEAGPEGLKISLDDGAEYSATITEWRESWGGSPARFHYGQLPSIRSGHGVELPIARERIRIIGSLLVQRTTIE